MKVQCIWPWLCLALSRIPTGASAMECTFERGESIFDNNNDFYAYLDQCTTIVAEEIVLGGVYDRLILPEVVNITGTILASGKDDHDHATLGTPRLKSIQMPKLRYLGGLDFRNVSTISYFSFDELRDVQGRIYIEDPALETILECGNLTHAGAITLRGTFTFTTFTSLRTVDNDFIFENCEGCTASDSEYPVTKYPRWFTFPSLVSVGYLKIAGVISRITLRNLATAGFPKDPNSEFSTDSGARFHLTEVSETVSLDLPELTTVEKQLYIHGDVDSISLPELRNADAAIHIDAQHPLDINFTLQSADSIHLHGRITSVHLPNLSSDTPVSLNSSYKCEEYTSLKDVSCPIPPNLSKKERIGMGVGIAAGVVCVTLGVLFLWRRRRRSREKVMEARRDSGPRTGNGNGNGVNSATELAGLSQGGMAGDRHDRPRTPPPAYAP